MEIVIERDACSAVLTREQKNILIRGATETNFVDVDCAHPCALSNVAAFGVSP